MKTLLPALSFLTVLVSSGYGQDRDWLNVPLRSAASPFAGGNSGAGVGEGARDLAGDDTTWGVVLPGVEYVVTPGGFKEPPGPGEGAGITVAPVRFEIRGTPGADVTVTVIIPDAFVAELSPETLPLANWTVNWIPVGDTCTWSHCWEGGPLPPGDSVTLVIGLSGATNLSFGATVSVPLTAPAGSYSAGISVSYPGSPGANSLAARNDAAGGALSDTTVYCRIEVVELTDASGTDARPLMFALHQNYPNPFNPATTISFDLPEAAHVRLSVFDALGREVSVPVDEVKRAGNTSVTFDAGGLPSGVYTYRITAGRFTRAMKMLLVK